MTKWFVCVDAEYYAGAHVVEADTVEEAVLLAKKRNGGNTYERYEDEVHTSHGNVEPACAVVPFDQVLFVGTKSRIKHLIEGDDWYDD